MNIESIRDSAVKNGMVVGGGKRYRVVAYRQLSDGSWVGVWFAQVGLAVARKELLGLLARGERAEVWRDGRPCLQAAY